MGLIVVNVMPKPEILDPQGKAVTAALGRLGFESFTGTRQGKRFELTVDGPVTEEHLAEARKAAETVLSNPVIEDVISVRDASAPAGGAGAPAGGSVAGGSPAAGAQGGSSSGAAVPGAASPAGSSSGAASAAKES